MGKCYSLKKREIPGSEDYKVLLLRSVIFKIEVLNKSLQALQNMAEHLIFTNQQPQEKLILNMALLT